MAENHRIPRAAYLQSLNDFREFLKERCRDHPGVTAEILYDIQLAVDEACTNIITHGYAGMDPGSIILDLEVEPDQLIISLTDFGHAFEPGSTPAPNIDAPIEEREMGGFGLFFIQQSVDQMDYRVTEDGNTMTLIKHLAKTTEDEHEN